MTSKQYRKIERLHMAIVNLRNELEKNDQARDYLFRAERELCGCVNNLVPQK